MGCLATWLINPWISAEEPLQTAQKLILENAPKFYQAHNLSQAGSPDHVSSNEESRLGSAHSASDCWFNDVPQSILWAQAETWTAKILGIADSALSSTAQSSIQAAEHST